ncbi:MAG: glucosaminidase domain-containing protein [Romboutsia sp.]
MSKKSIIGSIVLVLIIISFVIFIKIFNLKEINKNQIDVEQFIKYSDEVSYDKSQVNWKYVASIVGVLHDNKFENISDHEIKEIASLFLIKDKGAYKSLPLPKVAEKLKFNKKQIKRMNDYVEDLNNYGLIPSRLSADGKYLKFIDSIKSSAIENYNKFNILPSITIAQAILESNWGESELSSKYNNLFGIKAHSSWKGHSVNVETSEHYNQIIKDEFRAYKSKSDSLKDHAKFLSENPRYKEVLKKPTYIQQSQELQNAGYSTVSDENGNLTYKKLIDQIIQQYNLQLIDSDVEEIKR